MARRPSAARLREDDIALAAHRSPGSPIPMEPLRKYPRTPHLEGSRLQPGDEDVAQVPFAELRGRHLVVEEKVDGANAGISFGEDGGLRLQSRGHFLTGGPRERHFALLKTWATVHRDALWERLGARYVAYGEWLFARHTVFYDALPHYLLEFDVLDRHTGRFLSTARRRALWAGSPVVSVPVVHEGTLASRAALEALVRPSLYKSTRWREALREASRRGEVGARGAGDRAVADTDPSDHSEGLYVKWEDADHVLGRYKWVRASFLQAMQESGTHWLDRPLLENGLAPDATLW